jgi:transposase
MDCDALGDEQWERIKSFVPGGTKGRRGPRTDNRKFLDALLWMARSGGRWRDLPERLGDYRSVKRRYYRWIEMGVLDDMLETLAREADLEWLIREEGPGSRGWRTRRIQGSADRWSDCCSDRCNWRRGACDLGNAGERCGMVASGAEPQGI